MFCSRVWIHSSDAALCVGQAADDAKADGANTTRVQRAVSAGMARHHRQLAWLEDGRQGGGRSSAHGRCGGARDGRACAQRQRVCAPNDAPVARAPTCTGSRRHARVWPCAYRSHHHNHHYYHCDYTFSHVQCAQGFREGRAAPQFVFDIKSLLRDPPPPQSADAPQTEQQTPQPPAQPLPVDPARPQSAGKAHD